MNLKNNFSLFSLILIPTLYADVVPTENISIQAPAQKTLPLYTGKPYHNGIFSIHIPQNYQLSVKEAENDERTYTIEKAGIPVIVFYQGAAPSYPHYDKVGKEDFPQGAKVITYKEGDTITGREMLVSFKLENGVQSQLHAWTPEGSTADIAIGCRIMATLRIEVPQPIKEETPPPAPETEETQKPEDEEKEESIFDPIEPDPEKEKQKSSEEKNSVIDDENY